MRHNSGRVRGGPAAGAGHGVGRAGEGRRGAPHQGSQLHRPRRQHLRPLHENVINHGRYQSENNQLSRGAAAAARRGKYLRLG